jgi:putative NADH-flavin reductase
MKITIFGAAGGTGTRLLDLACAAGHESLRWSATPRA